MNEEIEEVEEKMAEEIVEKGTVDTQDEPQVIAEKNISDSDIPSEVKEALLAQIDAMKTGEQPQSMPLPPQGINLAIHIDSAVTMFSMYTNNLYDRIDLDSFQVDTMKMFAKMKEVFEGEPLKKKNADALAKAHDSLKAKQ